MIYYICCQEPGTNDFYCLETDNIVDAFLIAKAYLNPAIVYWDEVQSLTHNFRDHFWEGWVVIELTVYKIDDASELAEKFKAAGY